MYLGPIFNRSVFHISVYLVAITAHHAPIDSYSVFTHLLMKKFMKGLIRTYLVLACPTPNWDLALVLWKLSVKPFELMASCPEHLLVWKTTFLVAVTSAHRVGAIRALRHDLPYLTVYTEGVSLFPDIFFLLKVTSNFHSSVMIHLPAFYPNPRDADE